jgi:glucokinase
MEERLGLPVGIENDATCAAYAEFVYGAGRGADSFVMLTLGTGVGGGVVVGGQLFRAWTELGHMVIVEDGEPCQGACTGRGHLEAYCSGTAADKLAEQVLGPGATARDLVAQSHPALATIGHHLGVAIGSLVNIFGSERLVIGGGFGTAAAGQLIGPAREAVLREALAPAGEALEFELAELGTEAGLIGAGLVAFDAAR